ncbi:MAG: SDR family NAD(P)-dependent oxidoreductase [Gracilimonas sp.]
MDNSNRFVIITGANSGIGKEAAIRFAMEGYSVIMGCRNLEKSKPVQDEIITISKNENIYLIEVDMASFSSIKIFCENVKTGFPKLDILIHNAAYFNHGEKYMLSEDNIEITFATNVAGPFLMTHLLLEHLQKSDDARILNASSNIIRHFFSPKSALDFENLRGVTSSKYKHSVYTNYRNSKMAFLMLTFRMAEEFKELGIKVNSLQINGAKMSKDTLKKFKPIWRLIASIQNLLFPAPSFMASHYFDITTSDKFKDVSGQQINHKLEAMEAGPENTSTKDAWGDKFYPNYASKKDVTDKVWNLCREWTGDFLVYN